MKANHGQLSRYIRELIDSPIIEYHIELDIAGYVDNPRFIASTADKLALLRERVQFWRRPEFGPSLTCSIGNPDGDEDFFNFTFVRDLVITLPYPHKDSYSSVKLYRVYQPSKWTEGGGFPYEELVIPQGHRLKGFDPGQDLLVVAELIE